MFNNFSFEHLFVGHFPSVLFCLLILLLNILHSQCVYFSNWRCALTMSHTAHKAQNFIEETKNMKTVRAASNRNDHNYVPGTVYTAYCCAAQCSAFFLIRCFEC